MTKYEYDFVRLGEGWLSVKGKAESDYQQIIHKYAREGWRMVQIFAPGIGAYGAPKYYEIIFERPIQ